MTRVAIVSKPLKTELSRLLPELVEWLREHGFEPVLDRESAAYVVGPAAAAKGKSGSQIGGVEVRDRPDLPASNPRLVIVLGGDGTLLAVGRIFAATDTPILVPSVSSPRSAWLVSTQPLKDGVTIAARSTNERCFTSISGVTAGVLKASTR